MKKILITGKDSYIGSSFENWLRQPEYSGMYQVDTADMRDDNWKNIDFSNYDSVFHVAGIAHADVGKVTEEQKKLYYKVNCDLAVETAERAKQCGVKQFIYMSSIIVYGEGTSVRKKRVITKNTRPLPSNFYGGSKWKAEQKLRLLESEKFRIAILRPPLIYGDGCKGNYQMLKKLALKVVVFPDFPNQRSMLHIDLLCEFVRRIVEKSGKGLYFPQNSEYVKTAELVRQIARENGRKIYLIKGCNWTIYLLSLFPGKIGGLINKAFGSLTYEKNISTGFGSLDD